MSRGGAAAWVAGVLAIILVAQTPLGWDAVGQRSAPDVVPALATAGPTPTAARSTPGGTLVALGVRDTPENPGAAGAVGWGWAPWILLGIAALAVGAISLTLRFARRRKPTARTAVPAVALPEAVAPDELPADWPQL